MDTTSSPVLTTNGPPNAPAATARGSTRRARKTSTAMPANMRTAVDLLTDLLIDPSTEEGFRPGLGLAIRTLRDHRP